MCRVVLYLGEPTPINHFLYGPDNSLVKQSYNPRFMNVIQNLAGFGMTVWDRQSYHPEEPFFYKTHELPFFDSNLKFLANKLCADCLLAHVRGVVYSDKQIIVQTNAHPFLYDNTRLAFAHNGHIEDIDIIKKAVIEQLSPDLVQRITGTTDSEVMYALFLHHLAEISSTPSRNDVCFAIIKTLQVIRDIRNQYHLNNASPVNLFITDGNFLVVTRFVYDYGNHNRDLEGAFFEYHSLWYTYGERYGLVDGEYKMDGHHYRRSICFASEPLTSDITTWIEVPEYSMMCAWYEGTNIQVTYYDLDL